MRFKILISLCLFKMLFLTVATATEVNGNGLSNKQADDRLNNALQNQLAPKYQLTPDDSAITKENIPSISESTTCMKGHGIIVEGVKQLPDSLLKKWISEISPKEDCFAVKDINILLLHISQSYIEKGYITSRPVAVSVNSAGNILIRVVEGHVESIVSSDARIHTAGLFDDRVTNQVLNLKDIEQASDQINRLASRKVLVEVEPGTEFGGSILKLAAQDGMPEKDWQLRFNADDYTGHQVRGTLALSMDDLLHHNDNIFFSTTHELTDSQDPSRSYAGGISLPNGYMTYSMSGYASNNTNLLSNESIQTRNSGLSLKMDRMLSRSRNYLLSGFMSINRNTYSQNVESGGVLAQATDSSMPNISLGLNYVRQEQNYSIKLGIQHDIGFAGSQTDSNTGSTSVHYSSTNLQLRGDLNLKPTMLLYGSVQMQFSSDLVPYFKQFVIGGVTTIPGFRDVVVGGNRGGIAETGIIYALPKFSDNSVISHHLNFSFHEGWIFKDAYNNSAQLSSARLQYSASIHNNWLTIGLAHPLTIRNAPNELSKEELSASVGTQY